VIVLRFSDGGGFRKSSPRIKQGRIVEVIENRGEAALWRKLGVTVRNSDEEVCTLHLHREVNPSTPLETNGKFALNNKS
jgi:hypothetical protein